MSDKPTNIDFAAIRMAELEPWLPYLYGNRFAQIVAIKGELSAEEQAGQAPFFGENGQALEAALEALGFGSNSWCGIVLELPDKEPLSPGLLRMLIEIVDPLTLVALDDKAMELLMAGYGPELLPQKPKPGHKTRLVGRNFVFVEGFETALASQPQDGGEAKRRVWKELKALKN